MKCDARLEELGNGLFAYIQGDGGWGLSNAGLVSDCEEALLVDTLYDLAMTRDMLKILRDASGAAPGTLVNTHAHGDHTYGNKLMEGARIIASTAAAEEMATFTPEMMVGFLQEMEGQRGDPGIDYFLQAFGRFDYEGLQYTPPTETFDKAMQLQVGDKRVELIETGPAHSRGDVLVHAVDQRVVFTGDILFVENTPLMSEGSVQQWVDACEKIIAMNPEVVVPGHGPTTNVQGVRAVRDYLLYIHAEAQKRYQAGMSYEEAARDIALGDYSSWGDAERIVINTKKIYEELMGEEIPVDSPLAPFTLMAELKRSWVG